MARGALAVVVGMMLAVALLMTMLTSKFSEVEGLKEQLSQKSQAKNIASVVAATYVRELKHDPGFKGSYRVRDFLGGTARVSITHLPGDQVEISSIAKYKTAEEEVVFRLKGVRVGTLDVIASI